MKKSKNSVQGLIGLERFTKYGVKTDKAEIAFFSVEPTNISVLSAANIDVKIHHLMMLLSTIPDLEILALDSCECFDSNKMYVKKRLQTEKNEAVRKLLQADFDFLDEIQLEIGKALAGRKDLPAPALVQQRAEATDEIPGIVVDQAPERLLRRLFGGGELAAEMVVELAVAIEAQPLAQLHDARRGQIVLRSDLLDAHALLAALDVRRDAGDHLALVLRQQICQKKIIVDHT